MRTSKRFVGRSAILAGIFLSCVPFLKYTPDPKKDVEMWVGNLDRQRSFSYQYHMKTRTADVTGRGTALIGWGEHIKGRWQSQNGDFDFEYYGIDDLEYTHKGGSWVESARGEESNIFVQVQRMLDFDKFELLEKEPDYHYRFKANVPFLAPDKWKEMVGLMRVSPRNYLPDYVWAGLPDSSVFWEVRLDGFNRTAAIEAPVAKWSDFRLSADSSADPAELRAKVQRRLKLIGLPFRLKRSDRTLVLSMPAGYKESNVADLCAPGSATLHWLTDDKNRAVKIGYLMDDLKQPLLMTAETLGPEAIKDCRLSIDRISRPYFQLTLKRKLDRPGSLCLEVDSLILAQMTIDKGQNLSTIRVDIAMNYYQMNIIRAAIMQPLPPLTITPAPGE